MEQELNNILSTIYNGALYFPNQAINAVGASGALDVPNQAINNIGAGINNAQQTIQNLKDNVTAASNTLSNLTQWVPYIAVGGVLLVVLLSSKSGSRYIPRYYRK